MEYPPPQPDEGYSEDPLNPSVHFSLSGAQDVSGAMSSPRTPAEFPAWLTRQLPNLPVSVKTQLAMALLDDLPTSVIAQIVQRLNPRLYIDFVHYLPPEVCLKVLGFLDPVSLINVARSCRAWYDLALDKKLWERLYLMEGWRAIYPEIRAWEEKVNEGLNATSSSLHRLKSSEDGHTYKKRTISEDTDMEMTDADRSIKQENTMIGGSIFGSPASSFGLLGRASATPHADTEMEGSMDSSKSRSADSKGKGKASPLLRSDLIKEESLPPMIPANAPGGLAGSTLWSWEARASRYRINWKYLYTMRRRLESNWERGKYSNFQLPHPDHPEEGHSECIYSLQFDSEYLVSGSRDRTIRIWSMQSRRLVRRPLEGHGGSVLCLQFDADPEEDIVVSGSSDSDVIVWRFSTGEIIQRLTKAHSESVLNVKFDKRILVTCSKDKSIKIFNRRPLRHGEPGYDDPSLVYAVPIHLKSYEYGSPTDELPILPPFTMIGRLEGHGAAVNAVQICDNEVVSASGDRNIKVWDWPRQICSRTVVGHGKGIACVQYDGRRIVSGSSDNEVKVFDRSTGLEVASLRAHTSLVRTVQAGFGDLPYSVLEDQAEAKKVDEQYFKALESGAIQESLRQKAPRRRRNAGSRRPEDITAFGATLPPGGGGGKYARIVSGSYDQTIIIWRRDKEGVWKDVHHFRQEEAAEAASRSQQTATAQSQLAAATAAMAATEAPRSASPSVLPLHPSVRPPPPAPALARLAAPAPPTPRTTIENPIIATITPESATSFMALIDIIVPQGVLALQQALASYPTMLAYHSHLQTAIDREPSPFLRAQLRQTVSTAMLRTQYNQNRARMSAMQNASMPFPPPSLPSFNSPAGPSSSADATGGSTFLATVTTTPQTVSGSSSGPSSISRLLNYPSEPTPSVNTANTPVPASSQDATMTGVSTPHVQLPPQQAHDHPQPPHAPTQAPVAPVQPPPPQQQQVPQHVPQAVQQQALVPQHVPQAVQQQAQAPQHVPQAVQQQAQAPQHVPQAVQQQALAPQHVPQAVQQQALAPQQVPQVAQTHHPHIVNADNNPARVFKLQFDVRRIICCSQTSVIVGWDFCNGDPELEEVTRFFGTVE